MVDALTAPAFMADEEACLELLWRMRYSPDGVNANCPKCEMRRVFRRYPINPQRQSWTCTACGHHVHPTAGTILAKSSTPLSMWFFAMRLLATNPRLSAKQLERELGVRYKTAWRMKRLILRHPTLDLPEKRPA